ncbi:MAG TPA: IclR family transcriptional regulator [Stellaceae bacterium]|jgi:DNA-binding IclR family transcriptional regulator|nr:IclR family transcriptional regulator [Stellaceae bacterium]
MSIATTDADGDRPRVEAVERSILLLQCFREPNEKLSLQVLAERSGFYKSTILRLAASLTHMRLLERNERGQFLLGPELWRLGQLSRPHADMEDLVRAVLHILTDRTTETASFYVHRGQEMICLYRSLSPRSARHHLEEGDRYPLRTGAAGKILDAFGASPQGPQAETIRANGWAISLGERDPDLAAICAPVFNQEKRLLGAISVSGLVTRFTPERIDAYRPILLAELAALAVRLTPALSV